MSSIPSPLSGTSSPPHRPVERVLFALAGTVTLLSVGLAATLSPWFLLLGALVGVNQWVYAWLGICPAAFALQRLGFSASCRW
jgi:hypothetical protein